MRILYYNHTGKVSGAEKVMFSLIEGVQGDVEPVLASPPSEQFVNFCARHSIRHVPTHELRARFTLNPVRLFSYIASVLQTARQLRRQVRLVAPDLVHANSPRAGIIVTLATWDQGVPIVWHVHDVMPRHPLTWATQLLLWFSRRATVVGVSRAVTNAMRRGLLGVLPERVPMHVIYNGIASNPERANAADITRFREDERLLPEDVAICMIGQVTPRKGQLGVVRAFSQLRLAAGRTPHLLIVGEAVFDHDRAYRAEIEREIARLGVADRVHMLGHRRDIATILGASTLLVLNSSSEPFGLVLLEASIHAVPVVAASVDGVPELILDGSTGCLFQYGDQAGMVKAMQRIWEDPGFARMLGEAAFRRVTSVFTVEQFLTGFRELYREVLHGAPASISA